MELLRKDIKRLEALGYQREEFVVTGEDGGPRLKNVDGWCYFYSVAEKSCRVYRRRPLGCHIYPVIYVADERIMVDQLCPMKQTISKEELRAKEKILGRLLDEIYDERRLKEIRSYSARFK